MKENSFWARLKALLGDRREAWLAAQLGVNRSTVASWKRKGTLPRADILLKTAQILGVSTVYLATGEITEEDRYSQPVVIPELKRDLHSNPFYPAWPPTPEGISRFVEDNMFLIRDLYMLNQENLNAIALVASRFVSMQELIE